MHFLGMATFLCNSSKHYLNCDMIWVFHHTLFTASSDYPDVLSNNIWSFPNVFSKSMACHRHFSLAANKYLRKEVEVRVMNWFFK